MATIHRIRDGQVVDPPGGGGDNGGMEARLAKLEATIPTLATREDLVREFTGTRTEMHREVAGLRAEMHREFNSQTWRIIGAMLTFGGLLSAAVFFIARNVK